jgi:hypothetical protein
MPRTVFVLGVALYVVTLAFLATDALLWRPGVTERNARRVQAGMTLEEAQRILGGPPESRRQFLRWSSDTQQIQVAWSGDKGQLLVALDDSVRVVSVCWLSDTPPSSLLDRLHKALGH